MAVAQQGKAKFVRGERVQPTGSETRVVWHDAKRHVNMSRVFVTGIQHAEAKQPMAIPGLFHLLLTTLYGTNSTYERNESSEQSIYHA